MSGNKQIILLFKTIILIVLFLITRGTDQSKYQISIGRPSKQPFSSITHICCNGITQEKPTSDTKCCGNQTYRSNSQICCGESIIPNDGDLRCCSNKLYNRTTDDCTLFVTDANLNNDGVRFGVHNGVHVVLPITEEYTFPCGNAIINLNTTMCCQNNPTSLNGLKHPKCCDRKPYDPKVNSCCFGKSPFRMDIIPKVDPPENCCNKKPYNLFKQFCNTSDGTIMDLPDQNHTLCGNQIIDRNENICCAGNIITKLKSHHRQCCGTVSYSASEQSCCEGQLIPAADPRECCLGIGLYDPTKDTCCSPDNFFAQANQSKLFKDKLGKCCYMDVYDEMKEYCCGISVMPKLPDGQSNCCEYNINGAMASLDELNQAHKKAKNDQELYDSLYRKLEEIKKKKEKKTNDGNSAPFQLTLSLTLFLLSLFFSLSI